MLILRFQARRCVFQPPPHPRLIQCDILTYLRIHVEKQLQCHLEGL